MKTAEKLGFGISSFDFMLTPLQISEMGKPSKIGSGEQYIVELEKGLSYFMQVHNSSKDSLLKSNSTAIVSSILRRQRP